MHKLEDSFEVYFFTVMLGCYLLRKYELKQKLIDLGFTKRFKVNDLDILI